MLCSIVVTRWNRLCRVATLANSRVCCRSLSPVNWENVRVLDDGETVSIDGTHLGHNIPDGKNRYCINLVSIAGNPDECVN